MDQSGKRQVVVVARSRGGRTLTFIGLTEAQGLPFIRSVVETGATVHADEGTAWDALHASYDTGRVNHSFRYMDEGVCTNQAESYFSRLRRMEVGTHHHIAGPYLTSYASEAAWREDNRRIAKASRQLRSDMRLWLRCSRGSGRGIGSGARSSAKRIAQRNNFMIDVRVRSDSLPCSKSPGTARLSRPLVQTPSTVGDRKRPAELVTTPTY